MPVSTENIDALMEVPAIHHRFRKAYIAPGLGVVAGERLRRRAEWHFGDGGRAYCETTARRAATPALSSKPSRRAGKGRQVWDRDPAAGRQMGLVGGMRRHSRHRMT